MPFVCARAAHHIGYCLVDSETPFLPGDLESEKEVMGMSRSRGNSESLTNKRKQAEETKGFSRRSLLKNAAGAALGAAAMGLTGVRGMRGQVSGLYTTKEPPEIPLPMGSLTYLDRKQYIHNMEIHAHLPGTTITGGEPLCVMWARGKQRLLPGGAGFVDISEAKNPVVLNKGVTSSSFAS